jgi:hypothetical protein
MYALPLPKLKANKKHQMANVRKTISSFSNCELVADFKNQKYLERL